MKVDLQAGFVLHSRPYRDTSALVEAFTAGYGRIGLVARGARSEKSRLRGLLQPFRRVLLSWSGRGELQTLHAAEEVGPALHLSGARLISGFYVNELMMRLSHRGDANTQLFAAYAATLQSLAAAEDPSRTLRVFEKRLLESLGYGLQLQHDTHGTPIDPGCRYGYAIEIGPVPIAAAGPSDLEISGATLLALAAESVDDLRCARESKALMRFILGYYLGPQPLHSRALFRTLPGETEPPPTN